MLPNIETSVLVRVYKQYTGRRSESYITSSPVINLGIRDNQRERRYAVAVAEYVAVTIVYDVIIE